MEDNFILEYISEIVLLKCRRDLQYPTGVEEWLKCGKKIRGRGKQEHGTFFKPYKNLQQTEMRKIISYWNTFSKFVELICLRNLQHPTGLEELLKCGAKRRA